MTDSLDTNANTYVDRDLEASEIIRQLAVNAPDDIPLNCFAPEPPTWAVYEEVGMHGDKCGRCGSWCEVVRPGKTQCPACGDDSLKALMLRAKALVALRSGLDECEFDKLGLDAKLNHIAAACRRIEAQIGAVLAKETKAA
jgi:hypothetical protein